MLLCFRDDDHEQLGEPVPAKVLSVTPGVAEVPPRARVLRPRGPQGPDDPRRADGPRGHRRRRVGPGLQRGQALERGPAVLGRRERVHDRRRAGPARPPSRVSDRWPRPEAFQASRSSSSRPSRWAKQRMLASGRCSALERRGAPRRRRATPRVVAHRWSYSAASPSVPWRCQATQSFSASPAARALEAAHALVVDALRAVVEEVLGALAKAARGAARRAQERPGGQGQGQASCAGPRPASRRARRRRRGDGASAESSAEAPWAPSTWSQVPRSAHRSADGLEVVERADGASSRPSRTTAMHGYGPRGRERLERAPADPWRSARPRPPLRRPPSRGRAATTARDTE